ncbi:bifunctional 4-hydroxy-2-oxoglutarate aldolase/2-dehydro-3-deoxy-phosphogluconate aldolase [Flexithrix dorotheae]|uniref:bifunctional 4-hydroxy-2-oxoglutarate aldolase/2-dehydro-3-deoxy-phosphogluconate aldolase n=1 Tax=Flexithrix dorotheae TaxID=70993 RepID=UPI000374A202|nr:bifunctional 4-hydroxy-2-oxoglutarate aldolase/2-dehydro-3-deoxy-phosphogluconate aldolase [Flexithrix dorotheae]
MTKEEILTELFQTKIVAIIRLDKSEPVVQVAEALVKGGVKAIEVTIGTPNAVEEIEKLAGNPDILAGAGSVINAEMAELVIKAGAQFIVTPVSKPEIIEMAHRYGKPVLSGAFTPAEMLQAYEWGADIVKMFPAESLGLPYFKAVKAPLPQLPIMPTGGITIDNAREWIQNGAVCLGVGSTLVNKKLIAQNDYEAISKLARGMREAVNRAMAQFYPG